MTTDAITEYRNQMARAKRNFAICVVNIQQDIPARSLDWRMMADRLRSAIIRAERFARLGKFDAAVTLLGKEDEAA